MRKDVALALLLAPLLLAVLAGAVGVQVVARDDINYIAELESRLTLTLTPDGLAWIILSIGTTLAGLSSFGLRVTGLAIAVATAVGLLRRQCGERLLPLFVISVLPLYLNIYFNQMRLAVAILVFAWLVTNTRGRMLAVPASALAHSSFLLLLFPPLALVIPALSFLLGLDIATQLDPATIGVLKLIAYINDDSANMPWYLGWELLPVAGILVAAGRWSWALEVLAVILAARLISTGFNLDVGRRVLELGILAYSPFFLATQRGFAPPKELIWLYVSLGVLQIGSSLLAGIIQI